MLKKILFGATMGLLFMGCSSDDNGQPAPPNTTTYFPTNAQQYWVYEVTSEEAPSSRDSLYILGQEQINNKNYHRLKAREPFFGFYSSSLNNNAIREESGKLMVTGSFALPGFEDLIDLDLSLNDLIIFDQNASNNQQLSMISGETQQNIGDIPVKVTYVLRTNALNTIPSFTAANGQVYTNVKPMKVTLRLDVRATLGPPINPLPIPINVAVLDAQDVAISTSYWVENIGVVQTETNLQYQVSDLILTFFPEGLPIPSSGSSTSLEKLVDYYQP